MEYRHELQRGRHWVLNRQGAWAIAGRFATDAEGRRVLCELRVMPAEGAELPTGGSAADPPAGGLTARDLRRLKIGKLARGLERHLDATEYRPEAPTRRETLYAPPEVVELLGSRKRRPTRPGRRGHPLEFYAEAARAYVESLGSRQPVVEAARALGEAWGCEPPSIRYVRGLLDSARRRGLLTRPQPGRAGGELTEKGRAALEG